MVYRNLESESPGHRVRSLVLEHCSAHASKMNHFFFPFLFLLIYSPTVVQYLMINVSVSLFTQCAYLFITSRSLIYRWFNVIFLGVYGEKGIEYSQKSYQNYWWESLIQVPWFQITIPPSEVLSVIHLKNTFRWQCVKKNTTEKGSKV